MDIVEQDELNLTVRFSLTEAHLTLNAIDAELVSLKDLGNEMMRNSTTLMAGEKVLTDYDILLGISQVFLNFVEGYWE